MREEQKLKVIFTIDKMMTKLRPTAYSPLENNMRKYWRELNMLRKKYIYKDISLEEYVKDISYMKSIKSVITK